MSNGIQIRILRESVIAEMKWMFQPIRSEYFENAVYAIEENQSFCSMSDTVSDEDYEHFISNLKKFNNPKLPYYHETAELLKKMLESEDVRIWTKKEVLELHEVFTEGCDKLAQKRFLPIFDKVTHGEVLLIYKS